MTRVTKTRATILAVIVGGILTLSDPLAHCTPGRRFTVVPRSAKRG